MITRNHMKTMGNHRKTMGNNRKTIGNPGVSMEVLMGYMDDSTMIKVSWLVGWLVGGNRWWKSKELHSQSGDRFP